MKKRIKSDSGFMGLTHSTSALAVFLVILAFFPTLVLNHTDDNLWILIMACVTVIGAALMPDFDNTKSTAISTFGILGIAISAIVRSLNIVIRNSIKGKYDDNSLDPHRGFSHTLISGVLVTIGIFALTSININIPVPFIDREFTLGFIFASIIFAMCTKLAIASILHKQYKKFIKMIPLCNLGLYIISIGFAILVLAQLPDGASYRWLGLAVGLGWIIHIIGDAFTVAGVPLFFPFAKRGKRWWVYRIPPGIRAGGLIEDAVFIPIFTIAAVLALIKIITNFIL